jgi:hypothetical protein
MRYASAIEKNIPRKKHTVCVKTAIIWFVVVEPIAVTTMKMMRAKIATIHFRILASSVFAFLFHYFQDFLSSLDIPV